MIARGFREALWVTAAVVLGALVAKAVGAPPVYGMVGAFVGYVLGRKR